MNSTLTKSIEQLRAALDEDKDRGNSGAIEDGCTALSKEIRAIEQDIADDKYLQKGGGYAEEGLALKKELAAVKAAVGKLWDAAANYGELMKP